MRRIWGGIGARLAALDGQAVSRWNDRIASWLLGGDAEDEITTIPDAKIAKIVGGTLRSCLRSTGSAMRGSW
jgi:hypothetical protein